MAPKKKQEKMALGDFLQNQSLGSWADEMDSQPLPAASSNAYSMRDRGDSERRGFEQSSWGSARTGGAATGGGDSFDRPRYDREEIPFPTKPPYTAHLGNLDYNVTSVDVEEFLAECSVTTVRIMEDKIDRKPKGFGYVEFGSPEGLQKALNKTESSFMGRNIKISLADPPKNDRPEQTRDFSDWSRRGPLPDLPSQGRQPSNRGFSGRNFENAPDAGGERKPSFFEGDGKVRDFGNWERKGPLSPAPGAGAPVRDGGRLRDAGDLRERRGSPAGWGEGREGRDGQSDAGSRPPRKEFEPRPVAERIPTAAETDSQWRSNMRPDPAPAATPDVSTPTSPTQEAPKERPRLNLTKRTVSTAEPGSATTPSGDAKASPFGAARPIDTQQREREIEEKRQLAARQKKEADDKARDEKAARDAASRAARGDRADRGQNEEGETITSPTGERPRGDRRSSRQQQNGAKSQAKEHGEGAASVTKPSFSILQREDGDEPSVDGEAVDASANGNITGDKETKPQEVVVPAGGKAETTAEALEDDGWSTVAAKPKGKGRGGARALAS